MLASECSPRRRPVTVSSRRVTSLSLSLSLPLHAGGARGESTLSRVYLRLRLHVVHDHYAINASSQSTVGANVWDAQLTDYIPAQ